MKALKTAAKTVLFILADSWLTAFCVMAVCWMMRTNGAYLNGYAVILKNAFLLSACGYTAAFAVYKLVKLFGKSKRLRLLESVGYTDEYFDYLKQRAEASRRPTAKYSALCLLSDELCDGERFDDSLSVLEKAEELAKSVRQNAELCAKHLKIYCLKKDRIEADRYYAAILSSAGDLLYKKGVGGELCYACALYDTFVSEYEGAEAYARLALKYMLDRKKSADAELLYALCLVKNGKLTEAKKVTETVSGKIKAPYQERDLSALMTAVEKAYGV